MTSWATFFYENLVSKHNFFANDTSLFSVAYTYLPSINLLTECFSSFNSDFFSILDYAQTQFQIKIKESMYIDWEKPNLNKQLKHLATTLSIYSLSDAPFTSLFYLLNINYLIPINKNLDFY